MSKGKRAIVYAGNVFTIEWFQTPSGKSQARDFFKSLSMADRAKTIALFERMADIGKIYDKTKFRHEEGEIYAFKPQPNRFMSCFYKGKRIIILSGFVKKSQKLPKKELKRAEEYLQQFKRMEGKENE
jgi:phage-related protein